MNLQRALIVISVWALSTLNSGGKTPSGPDLYWPQWRGPEATGVAPHGDPPVEWSETQNVRWKIEIPGEGHSTPIVWGNQVFVTTAVETDEAAPPKAAEDEERNLPEWRRRMGVAPTRVLRFMVISIDRRDGKVLWRRTLREAAPHQGRHAQGSWAPHSPVVDGRHLIAYFGSNGLYSLDLKGNLKWEKDLGKMTTRLGFGEGSSPVLHRDTLVVNWDHEGRSFLIALNKKTGKTLWEVDRDEGTSWSTPIVVDHGGKTQVIVSATRRTRGYDLATGKMIWEAGGMTMNTIPTPVSAKGRVYVTSGFRGNALQAIDLAAANGDITDSEAIAWQHDQDTPYVPSPLLYGDRIYFLKRNNGILSCFDARTGEEHYSRQRLDGIDAVFASLVGASGRVYIAGRNGTTLVVKDGSRFEVVASNSLEDGFVASPAIAGDELFLRGLKNLYCVARDLGD